MISTTKYITILRSLLAGAIMLSASSGSSMPAQVTAKVDSGNLLMGKIGMLHLQVVLDKGSDLKFPMVETATQHGLMPLVSDSIELRTHFATDTVVLGGNRIQINCRFPMQAFVPGSYMLPSIPVVVGTDTVRSNRLALSVTGPDVQATDSISPDAGPMGPYYTGWQKAYDKIPDFIYYYWWVIIILLLAIGGLIWYLVKHPVKKVPWIKPKPEPTPYELAITRLKKLRASKLAEAGQDKEYYSRLTDILRQYLWGRFGINALEMTTQQIRKAVRNSPDAKDGKKYVEDVLGMADFVKFAKFKPLPDDNIKSFEDVVQFIEQTKPKPQPEDTAEASEKDSAKTVKS